MPRADYDRAVNTYGQDRQEAPYGAAPYIQSLAGGVLRKARCNRCGAPAAWAKSKSGRLVPLRSLREGAQRRRPAVAGRPLAAPQVRGGGTMNRQTVAAETQAALAEARNGRRAFAKFTLLGIAARVGIDRQRAHELGVEDLAALIQKGEAR